MLTNVEYGRCLPSLIELRFFNFSFDLKIVLNIHFIVVHALQKFFFVNTINTGKLFADSIEF